MSKHCSAQPRAVRPPTQGGQTAFTIERAEIARGGQTASPRRLDRPPQIKKCMSQILLGNARKGSKYVQICFPFTNFSPLLTMHKSRQKCKKFNQELLKYKMSTTRCYKRDIDQARQLIVAGRHCHQGCKVIQPNDKAMVTLWNFYKKFHHMSKIRSMSSFGQNKLELTQSMKGHQFSAKDHYKHPYATPSHVKARSHVPTSQGRLLRQTTCNRYAPMVKMSKVKHTRHVRSIFFHIFHFSSFFSFYTQALHFLKLLC